MIRVKEVEPGHRIWNPGGTASKWIRVTEVSAGTANWGGKIGPSVLITTPDWYTVKHPSEAVAVMMPERGAR